MILCIKSYFEHKNKYFLCTNIILFHTTERKESIFAKYNSKYKIRYEYSTI